ncbi:hypothetical protein HHL16_08605 [Pseudoflavitalea sp. G-6-1-2]|uniref:NHL domain-containing protein n=1 Tax=Pseudoflavitalea sp. G-6-1-2 TaxID=2728841 RepID=UPI00146A09D7|nr:IPT/TIG domain-containing protein [Pseudoflavitalea sp. G-6-1-2]NML20932.1 hypothetical protein [Pseudoflavitalea sp. G-6-1-2]
MKKILVAVSFFGLLCCSKPDVTPLPNPEPASGANGNEMVITSISPASAESGNITITGTGFSTAINKNFVEIGGVTAVITKASATQLEVEIPEALAAGDHDIRITRDQIHATRTNAFHRIGWVVQAFAGSGKDAQTDGPAVAAAFKQPRGMVADNAGNIYVADLNMIRKISTDGIVSTLAGRSGAGYADGKGANAIFNDITSLAIDSRNNLYSVEKHNNVVRKITPDGEVTTIAGKPQLGNADGVGSEARFYNPYGIAINAANTHLYIGDQGNFTIRKIDLADNMVTTVAGNGEFTRKDGVGLNASFASPGGLTFDKDGNLLIAEQVPGQIRKMDASLRVTTLGDPAANHPSESHMQLAFDNNNQLYVSMGFYSQIKKFAPDGTSSIFAGVLTGSGLEHGAANQVKLNSPEGIVIKYDAQGKMFLYVADSFARKIKVISKQ